MRFSFRIREMGCGGVGEHGSSGVSYRNVNGVIVPTPSVWTLARMLTWPHTHRLVFGPEQILQLVDGFEVLGLKSRTHRNEQLLVPAHDEEIKDADIRCNRRRRALD